MDSVFMSTDSVPLMMTGIPMFQFSGVKRTDSVSAYAWAGSDVVTAYLTSPCGCVFNVATSASVPPLSVVKLFEFFSSTAFSLASDHDW